jgi:replication factor C large subunit
MKIAETASGDLRSAINDLQAAAEGLTHLTLQDVATAERDVKSSIFRVLDVIFRGGSTNEALQASRTLDENPEDLVHWIDENIPIAYKGNDLYTAFESLSRADVFLGRVSRRQNYGLWRYAGFFMTAGVAACRTSRGSGYIAFKPPSLWRRMGQTRRARGIRDSAARKLARHVHVGTSYARCELMEFAGMLLASKEIAPAVAASLELDAEEIALLIGSSSSTKKVQSIFEEASRIREAERISDIKTGWSTVPAHDMQGVAGELGRGLSRKGEVLDHPVQAVRIDAKAEPEGKGIAEHSAAAPSTKQDETVPGASQEMQLPEAKAKRKPGRPRKSESKAKADGAAKRQRSLFEF